MTNRLAADLLNGSMWQDVHGRERVHVVCPCGAIVAKALTAPGKQWLNTLNHPRPGAWGEYRREHGRTKRVAAPNLASGGILHGPSYPDRETWCDRDGVLVIPMDGLFAAMASAVESGNAVRFVARRSAADGSSTLD